MTRSRDYENARTEVLAAMNERRDAELAMLKAKVRKLDADDRYNRAMLALGQFSTSPIAVPRNEKPA